MIALFVGSPKPDSDQGLSRFLEKHLLFWEEVPLSPPHPIVSPWENCTSDLKLPIFHPKQELRPYCDVELDLDFLNMYPNCTQSHFLVSKWKNAATQA